jgi:hypothetical protein
MRRNAMGGDFVSFLVMVAAVLALASRHLA